MRALLAQALLLASLTATPAVLQAAECAATDGDQSQGSPSGSPSVCRALGAVEAYVSAPLHWNARDWGYFGGVAAAVAVAHEYDSEVRQHFVGTAESLKGSSDTVQDALPAAALLLGTWGYAQMIDDADGRSEAGTMVEATLLSVGSAYALNYASGRKGPDQTTNPNRWWSGGTSFPSEHTTAAFAIGAVLAESGNERYRWVRRILGYGVAGFTAYQRLNHNAHWLSDTVAGAALGAASAHFAMSREDTARDSERESRVAVIPIRQGVMLHYTVQLP